MYLTTVTSNQRFIVIVYWKPIFWLVRFTEQIRYSNRLHGYFFFFVIAENRHGMYIYAYWDISTVEVN